MLYSGWDSSINCIGVFLELATALDTIGHSILLHKLTHYLIKCPAYFMFTCCLTNKQQCTTVNGKWSSNPTVKYSVPQDSIFRSLLFTLYINDIWKNSKKYSFVLFADYTNIFFTESNLKSFKTIACNELQTFYDRFHTNCLLM